MDDMDINIKMKLTKRLMLILYLSNCILKLQLNKLLV